MPRGGKRKGAGAPKGNMNALKHGRYSTQFAELGAALAASPAARASLIRIASRDAARNRKADAVAAEIISQVIARGLVRGRDRLILLPPLDDSGSIVRNHETHEEKREFTPDVNQTPGSKTHGQSEVSYHNPLIDPEGGA